MNQWEFREQTSRLLVALKNAINQVALGLRLIIDWKGSSPFQDQSQSKIQKTKQTRVPSGTQLKICSNQRNQKDKQNKNEYTICSENSYKYLIRFDNFQTQFWSIRRRNYKIRLLINLPQHISFFQRSTCRCCSTSEVIQAQLRLLFCIWSVPHHSHRVTESQNQLPRQPGNKTRKHS